MRVTKKIFAALAALMVIGAVAFAQDEESTDVKTGTFTFWNELSSDIVYINSLNHVRDEDDGKSIFGTDGVYFAGIAEEVFFQFDSERVDAGVDLKFKLAPRMFIDGIDWNASENIALGWEWDDLDYWLEFRPFKILTLAYHDNVYMYGSYLPVAEKNINAGNLGSDGFTVFVRPINGLRIAASVPFADLNNYINGDSDDFDNRIKKDPQDTPFTFGLGVDYTHNDFFSVGVGVHDVIDGDEITIGGYGLIRPLKSRELTIRAGFAHTQADVPSYAAIASGSIGHAVGVKKLDHRRNYAATIVGTNVYNVSVDYMHEALSLGAEVVGNIDKDECWYDMYIGLLFGYQFTDVFGFEVRQRILLGFNDESDRSKGDVDAAVDITPKVFFKHKRHLFSAGVDLEFCGSNIFVGFPISWKYTL